MVDIETLTELSQRAKQLNERSDSLSKSIDALNDQLAAMNLGMEFWLEDKLLFDSGLRDDRSTDPPERYRSVTCLGFAKLENKWQLGLRGTTVTYEWNRDLEVTEEIRDEEYVPLSKAGRDMRLSAVDVFDDLLEGLSRLTQEKIEVIERAAALAKPE